MFIPSLMCHATWQWNAQTPATRVSMYSQLPHQFQAWVMLTRVVKLNLHNQIPIRTNDLSVTPHRIRRIDDRGAVPAAYTLGENLHVVAVDMHGMRGGEADGRQDQAEDSGVAHIVDLALGSEVVGVSELGLVQDGVVVIA